MKNYGDDDNDCVEKRTAFSFFTFGAIAFNASTATAVTIIKKFCSTFLGINLR